MLETGSFSPSRAASRGVNFMQSYRALLLLPLCALSLWAQPAPEPLTLAAALQLARANSVQFHAAQADASIAREDRIQSRATLLPSVSYNNQFLYTQGNGTPAGRYLANNAVHEYVSQGNAHQEISAAQFASYRQSSALAALARARADLASRGLVVTVVQDYYALLAAARKHANARTAAEEAARFLDLSRKLESGGEVAHSDVLKAQLQSNDRTRDLGDSATELLKARMELAVLILPSVTAELNLADDLDLRPPLPTIDDVRRAAADKNPELRAALAAVQASRSQLSAARAGHLPSLSLDYFYGIDAPHFATRTDGVRNLGYSAAATLNIPVFNWGAIQSKVRQSEIRRDQARLELTTAQKQLLADVETSYAEAATAASQLATLQESATIAAESLRLIGLRYQAGESTVLEVVDAQNTLSSARNAAVDGSRRYRIALANLQMLTGTL